MTTITELRAENIKRLRVVEVQLRHGVVSISGRNGQGKSSQLAEAEVGGAA